MIGMTGSALPLAVRLWLMGMKSKVSFLTVATASYFLPSRRRKAASLSWVWSMCSTAVSRRRADTPDASSLRKAIASMMAPRVVL
ncbi:hypothetical protein D3C72_1666720 [compost metagenome]